MCVVVFAFCPTNPSIQSPARCIFSCEESNSLYEIHKMSMNYVLIGLV